MAAGAAAATVIEALHHISTSQATKVPTIEARTTDQIVDTMTVDLVWVPRLSRELQLELSLVV